MKSKDGTETVVIGRIGSPIGLKGEVRVTLYAQDSDNLKEDKVLLLKHAGKAEDEEGTGQIRAAIKSVRFQKGRPVISLEGIDDRNASEAIRGMEIGIDSGELEPLPEGEHYVRDMIGCTVVDTAGGGRSEIGVLKDVIQNTAQSILEVETAEGATVLIPAVDAFLRDIDEEARLIEVELIPGFY